MEYYDRVYGKCEIEEPVILELIGSPELQRLKRIDQGGYGPFWMRECGIQKEDYEHSRFSHSVGVYLLLRRYGASLEEQIAGLIHDASHTAFSHCTEYALAEGDGKEQDHQDNIHAKFVRGSSLAGIVERYGYHLDHILEDGNFPLKEKSLPDLCADRIDYVLRDAKVFAELDDKGADYFLDNLRAENGRWYFCNLQSVRKFAELFRRMNAGYYAGLPSARMFCAVGDFIKHALEKGYIAVKDLEGDDESVVRKAREASGDDEHLEKLFLQMEGEAVGYDDQEKKARHIVCKSRVVDPLFVDKDSLRRLSEAEPRWREVLREEMKPKEYYVKFKNRS